MNTSVRTFLGGLLAAACAVPAMAQVAAPRTVVGPNILVSRDGDVPHVELMIATSPRNPKHLLGGAIAWTRPEGGTACRGYSSTDGGLSWKTADFPEHEIPGGGDPQVAFTANGTALFVALTFAKKDDGKTCVPIHVWRSEDGGDNWGPMIEIPCDKNWDHEQIVVDLTKGRHAGRIYIGALYGYPVYRIGIFRSDDDGRTWTGPVEAANGGGQIGINVIQPMVLSDGTLVVPYGDFDFLPEKRKLTDKATSGLWTVASTDGGLTFSAPRKVATQEYRVDPKEKSLGLAGFPKFGADSDPESPFRDRIYTAWEDGRLGSYRILTSWSSDKGKTWSAPKPVDGTVSAKTHQFQPAVAVNKDGTVAVTWFDTRNSPDGNRYDQYLAASLDGGATFLPAVRVSSESSDPRGAGNKRQLTPMAMANEGKMMLSFLSAAGWTAGGHYMGLAADKTGDFHPMWVDARNGTSQIYTARVKVESPKKADPKSASGAAAPPAPAPARAEPVLGEPRTLVEQVELVFDPTTFDTEKNEIAVPIRIRNVSKTAIHPPIRLELEGFGFGREMGEAEKEFWEDKAIEIINASNGKRKEGAVFEFDGALAGSDVLEPGAVTNPVVVRVKLSDPFFAPTTRWEITGRLAGQP